MSQQSNQLCYHVRFIVDSIKNYVCNTPDAFLGCWFLNDSGGLKGSINSSFEEA